MDNLIQRVRLKIGDTEEENPVFTDEEIQDALDVYAWSTDVDNSRWWVLTSLPTLTSGATSYLVFKTPDDLGDWEETATFYDSGYNAVTPTTKDWVRGRFTFSTSQDIPVYIVGVTYDLNATAADLLEYMLARAKSRPSITQDGTQIDRGEVFRHTQRLQALYRAKARSRSLAMVRNDVATV